MPHTRSKRAKALAQAKALTLAQSTQQHTKRQQIADADGWTHIVDRPRARTLEDGGKEGLKEGDFERGGVWYVTRTAEEMRGDLGFYGQRWKEGGEGELRGRLGFGDVEGKEGKGRKRVQNVVVLGLGSLQSARREGRRASWTQLVALRSLISILCEGKEEEMEVIFQDPQFTELDKEFLASLGYKVVEDPEAFGKIGEESLVYAIHCYADVYRRVSEGRPAMLVGTDVENFGRFNTSEKAEEISRALREMVEGCEEVEFPQVRHDFSDTKIYWRKMEGEAVKDENLGLNKESSELSSDPGKDLEKLSLGGESPELPTAPTKDAEKPIIDATPELAVENDK